MATIASSTGPNLGGDDRRDGRTLAPSVAQPPSPTLEGVLHGIPSFHEYLSGATLARLCSTSTTLRDTAIDLATQVLLNERRACLGMPPHGDATPVEREALPEGFPRARLPGLVAQSEALLSKAALQISYTLDTIAIHGVRVVAHAPIWPLAKHAAKLPYGGAEDHRRNPLPSLPRLCYRAVTKDKSGEEAGTMLPLDLNALWWAEVEEEVRRRLRRTPVSSGGPFTRHDVLRVLALRAAASEDHCGLDYVGRFSMGIFLLKDGRVALVGIATDVDSWGELNLARHVEISRSLELLVRLGMADWERRYLGVTMPHDRRDVMGRMKGRDRETAAQGGGGRAAREETEPPRGTKRRHHERDRRKRKHRERDGRTEHAKARDDVWGTGGRWHEEFEAPRHQRPWQFDDWQWAYPIPPFHSSCNTMSVQEAKRPTSSGLSRYLPSSYALMVEQKCYEPLAGVTVTVTAWAEGPATRNRLYVWQLDNKSAAPVHFVVEKPVAEVEAGRCVDVLCAYGFLAEGKWEVVSDEFMWEQEQYEMESKMNRWKPSSNHPSAMPCPPL